MAAYEYALQQRMTRLDRLMHPIYSFCLLPLTIISRRAPGSREQAPSPARPRSRRGVARGGPSVKERGVRGHPIHILLDSLFDPSALIHFYCSDSPGGPWSARGGLFWAPAAMPPLRPSLRPDPETEGPTEGMHIFAAP